MRISLFDKSYFVATEAAAAANTARFSAVSAAFSARASGLVRGPSARPLAAFLAAEGRGAAAEAAFVSGEAAAAASLAASLAAADETLCAPRRILARSEDHEGGGRRLMFSGELSVGRHRDRWSMSVMGSRWRRLVFDAPRLVPVLSSSLAAPNKGCNHAMSITARLSFFSLWLRAEAVP